MARALVLFALLAVLPAVAADPGPSSDETAANWYFKIKDIPGPNADGSIPVTGFAWDTRAEVGRFVEYTPAAATDDLAAAPRGAASGLPTGKRQHKPFTITKQLDRASPILLQAVVNGRPIGDVEVWKEEDGARSHAFTLQNAMISSYSVSGGGGGGGTPTESISFVYEQIVWPTNPPSGGRSGR